MSRAVTDLDTKDSEPRLEVSWRVLSSYAGPIFGLSTTLFLIQFYFLKFASDVLLIAPATAGVIFFAGRIWDSIADPLVGSWSDRTRSRLGRRRPWLFAAIPVLAVACVMIWAPPRELEGFALMAYVAFGLLLYFTGFTIYDVPHMSLGAELSTHHHERTRIFGANAASFTLGIFIAFGAIQYVMNADDGRLAAAHVVMVMVPIACALLLIPPVLLRERPEYQGRGGGYTLGALRDVLRNPHARRLLTAKLTISLGIGVIGVLAPFFAEYILRRPDLIGLLPGFFVVPQVLAIPLWVKLSRRYGKKKMWLLSMVGNALSFGGMIFVGEDAVVLVAILATCAGVFLGCDGALGLSLLADVIDFDEHQTGERKEGVYSAASNVTFKVATALIVITSGVALELAGFVPNTEQSSTVQLTIMALFAGLPFVTFLAGAVVFMGYRLDEPEHARIRAELDSRSGEAVVSPNESE